MQLSRVARSSGLSGGQCSTADGVAQVVAAAAGDLVGDAHVAHRVQHLRFGRPLLVERSREVLAVEPAAVPDLRHVRPVARHLLQDLLNERRAPVRHELGHLVRAAQNLLLELRDGVGAERHQAGHHEVEEDAERPDVDVHAVVALVFEQLRRRVRRRPAERVQRLRGAGARAEPEVAHFHDVRRRQVYVLRLQVAMDRVLRVLREPEHSHTVLVLYNTHNSTVHVEYTVIALLFIVYFARAAARCLRQRGNSLCTSGSRKFAETCEFDGNWNASPQLTRESSVISSTAQHLVHKSP